MPVEQNELQRLKWVIPASLICHMLVFALCIYGPVHFSSRKPIQKKLFVKLVSLPPAGPITDPGPLANQPTQQESAPKEKESPKPVKEKTPLKSKTKEKEVKPKVEVEKEKPPKVKPRAKKSLKKKTFKSTKMIKKAIAEMEKKAETSRAGSVSSAIDRLKKQVGKTSPRTAGGGVASKNKAQGLGVAGGTGSGVARIEDIYYARVRDIIEQNWAYPQHIASASSALKGIVQFNIFPDGRVKDVWLMERSGNNILDESVEKAVKKSSPLPPFPSQVRKPYLALALKFSDKGIQ